MNKMPGLAKAYVAVVVVAGCVALGTGVVNWAGTDAVKFVGFLAAAALAALLKLTLPGIDGSMSVNMPVILLAVAQLNTAEAMVVALVATAVQSLYHSRHGFRPVQFVFNLAMIAAAIRGCVWVFHFAPERSVAPATVYLVLSGCMYFLATTVPVALAVGSSEKKNPGSVWGDIFMLSFPYYVLATGLAATANTIAHFAAWYVPLALLPILYGVYRSYRFYFGETEQTAPAYTKAATAGR